MRRRLRRVVMLLAAVLVAGLLTGLAGAPAAAAINPADVPPIGADAGRFDLPVACDITTGGLPIGRYGFDVDITGVAPASLGPGQQFFLTEGSGTLTIPDYVTSVAGLLGASRADATVRALNIGASRSTPDVINVAGTPIVLKDIPITAGRPLKVTLPTSGSYTVGPFTAPASGRTTLQFAGATIDIRLYSLLGPLDLTARCTGTGNAALLTIAVGGAAGQPPAAYTGVPVNFPAVPVGQLVGTVTAPYTCTFGGRTLRVGVAVNGVLPLATTSGTPITVSQGSGALVVPAAQVNALLDAGVHRVGGVADRLDLTAENATVTARNVLPAGGLTVPDTTLVRDRAIVVPLPAAGVLPDVAFTPAPGATSMTVALGQIDARLQVDGNAGQATHCAAPDPASILAEFPVR